MMSSSYLLFTKKEAIIASKELLNTKTSLSKELKLIEKNTMEVVLQSIRRASKLNAPQVPSKIHLQNYKNAIHDLFAFACQLRFALAPLFMITSGTNINCFSHIDRSIIIKELSPIQKLVQTYTNLLSSAFEKALFTIYMQGMQYFHDNERLFLCLAKKSSKKTFFGGNFLWNFFDFCALPPQLYKISTAKELLRRGYFVPSNPLPNSFNLVITVNAPGFPDASFGRGWNTVLSNKNDYQVIHLSNSPLLNHFV